MKEFNLNRFVDAQKGVYDSTLAEIKSGKKTGHWMWFIFLQIKGLGYSDIAQFYAIENVEEAQEYLNHPILGRRLVEMSTALIHLTTNDPIEIFGTIDSMKLQSSMTLFSLLESDYKVFKLVLDKFFNGERDPNTIKKVNI